MKTRYKILLLLAAIPLFGWMGHVIQKHASGNSAAGRKILYYQDSMHPWVKSDQPGKCTICSMDLTPLYQGEKGFSEGGDVISLSSNNLPVLHVQSEEVRPQVLSRRLRVAGTLEANESRRAIISAPAPGRIQSLGVEYAGVEVRSNEPLVTILSAELIQKRAYIRAANIVDVQRTNTAAAAGMRADPFSSMLLAPHGGTVIERAVVPGQYVLEGDRLLTIVDPSVMWFRFDIYQRDLPWYEPGQTLEVTVEGLPGKTFPAVIAFIEPTLNDATRTVKVRADIQNPIVGTNGHPRRLLRFGMYAEGRVQAQVGEVLAVPRSAILFPGGAAYAYVEKGNGAYERRRVQLGRQGDQLWEVLRGLDEGERVVTSGNVLIDAQAQFNRGEEDAADTEMPAAAESGEHHAQSAGLSQPGVSLQPAELTALQKFLEVADGISRALAADSLEQLRPHAEALPKAVTALAKEFRSDHPWQEMFKRLEATARWANPKDLSAARKSFLPFSTNVVDLVQRARSQESALASLKVYHCPMAPKPGLWFQAKGPLRNPYFGAEMLACGEEVRAPAAPVLSAPRMELATPTPRAAPPAARHPPHAMAVKPATAASMAHAPTDDTDSTNALVTGWQGRNRLQVGYARVALSEEMRAKRWAAITAAHTPDPDATNSISTNPPPRIIQSIRYEDLVPMPVPPTASAPKMNPPSPVAPHAASALAPAPPEPAHDSPPAEPTDESSAEAETEPPAELDLTPLSDEKLKELVAKATPVPANPADGLSPGQRQSVGAFLAAAGRISQALAADNLPQFKEGVGKLAPLLASLQKEFAAPHHWSEPIKRLAASQWPPAKDLAEARKQFLPFSTATVALAKQVQKEHPTLASLKVYHCFMAPKPGLWIQANGPLANPFYGAEMLRCGEEVKQ